MRRERKYSGVLAGWLSRTALADLILPFIAGCYDDRDSHYSSLVGFRLCSGATYRRYLFWHDYAASHVEYACQRAFNAS